MTQIYDKSFKFFWFWIPALLPLSHKENFDDYFKIRLVKQQCYIDIEITEKNYEGNEEGILVQTACPLINDQTLLDNISNYIIKVLKNSNINYNLLSEEERTSSPNEIKYYIKVFPKFLFDSDPTRDLTVLLIGNKKQDAYKINYILILLSPFKDLIEKGIQFGQKKLTDDDIQKEIIFGGAILVNWHEHGLVQFEEFYNSQYVATEIRKIIADIEFFDEKELDSAVDDYINNFHQILADQMARLLLDIFHRNIFQPEKDVVTKVIYIPTDGKDLSIQKQMAIEETLASYMKKSNDLLQEINYHASLGFWYYFDFFEVRKVISSLKLTFGEIAYAEVFFEKFSRQLQNIVEKKPFYFVQKSAEILNDRIDNKWHFFGPFGFVASISVLILLNFEIHNDVLTVFFIPQLLSNVLFVICAFIVYILGLNIFGSTLGLYIGDSFQFHYKRYRKKRVKNEIKKVLENFDI